MATPAAPVLAAEPRASSLSGTLVGAAAAGALATGITVWLVHDSPLLDDAWAMAAVRGLIVASYAAVGVYTWWRRPASRLGLLVAGVAFLYTVAALAAVDDPVSFTVGRVALAAFVVYLAYLSLCFPRDRPATETERRFIVAFAGITAAVWALVLALAGELPHAGPLADCTERCPGNAFQLVETSQSVTGTLDGAANAVTAAVIVALIAILVRKARSPARLRRRAVLPLLYANVLLGLAYVLYTITSEVDAPSAATALRVVAAAGGLAIPAALLVGQVRAHVFATAGLSQLVRGGAAERVTPRWVEGVLREAVGDPSLALGVWNGELSAYVDTGGTPVERPPPSPRRSVTYASRGGLPAVVLVHDASFEDDPVALEGLAATAAMLLENEHLVDELQASRARIAGSAERERVRLERDLHDGAQQGLLAVQVRLALLRERAGDAELATRLEALEGDLSTAVGELRTIAHGIYPTVLRERGLGPALESAAAAAANPVRVVDHGVGRCSSGVESAVYYCALEAMQNAAKHGGRGAGVVVTLARRGDRLQFGVEDDGAGFDPATAAAGLGLVSMRDRVGAVGGTLQVVSSPGGGTLVLGSVPVGDP